MNYLEKFRERFKVFANEPWFEATVLSLEAAWDQDDEYLENEIVKGLIQTAKQRGTTIYYRCGYCDEYKPDLEVEADQCGDCKREDLLEEEHKLKAAFDEKMRRSKLTPGQRAEEDRRNAEARRFMREGLIARDVQ